MKEIEEYERDGKWTVRVGDHVKVNNDISEKMRRYYGERPRLGFTGTVMRFTIRDRDGVVLADVTDRPVTGKRNPCRLRTVRADRLTKTNTV